MLNTDTNRLEAFSDGVIAVLITIMVLELKAPAGDQLQALRTLMPNFLVYALSFVSIGTYWNNHHHLLKAAVRVTPRIMWSNMLLLFSLSLIPFFTAWFGQNHASTIPTACYGGIMFFAAMSYYNLVRAILADAGADSAFAKAVGDDYKGKLSAIATLISIPVAFISTWAAIALFIAVTAVWFIPERRFADQ